MAHGKANQGVECRQRISFFALGAAEEVVRCQSRRITAKTEVDEALEEMLDSKGPYVLDVMAPYQEHVLPMIPSGRTVRDIIKA